MNAPSSGNGKDPLVGNFRTDDILIMRLKIKESTLEDLMLTLNYKPQSPESQFYERIKDSFSKNAGFLTKDIADFFKIVTKQREDFYSKISKVSLEDRRSYVRYVANLPEATLDTSKTIPYVSKCRGSSTKLAKSPEFETQAVLFNYALLAIANAQEFEDKSLSDRQIAQKSLMEAIVCLKKVFEWQQGMTSHKKNEVFPAMMLNCLRFLISFSNLKLTVIELMNGIEYKDQEIPKMAMKCIAVAEQTADIAKKNQIDFCSPNKFKELIKYLEIRLALFYIDVWGNDYTNMESLLGVYQFLLVDGRITPSDPIYNHLNHQYTVVTHMNRSVHQCDNFKPFKLDIETPPEPEIYPEIEEDLLCCPEQMSELLTGDLYRVYVEFKEVMKLQYNEIFNTISASLGNQKKAITGFQKYTFVLSQSKTDELKKLLTQIQAKGSFGKNFYIDFESRIAECEERISRVNAKRIHQSFKAIKDSLSKKHEASVNKRSADLLKRNTAFVNERLTNSTTWQEFADKNLKDLGKNTAQNLLDSIIDNTKKLEELLVGKEKPLKDMLMRVYTDMRHNPGRTEAPTEITTEFFQKLQADQETMIAKFESLNQELSDYIDRKLQRGDSTSRTINVHCPSLSWCDRLKDFQVAAAEWEQFDGKLTKLMAQIEEVEVTQVPNTVIHFDTKADRNPKVKSYPVTQDDNEDGGEVDNASLASLENVQLSEHKKMEPTVVIPNLGATYTTAMYQQRQQNQPGAYAKFGQGMQNPIVEEDEYRLGANRDSSFQQFMPNSRQQFVPENADNLDSRFSAMSVAGQVTPSYGMLDSYGQTPYKPSSQSTPDTAYNYHQMKPEDDNKQQYPPQQFPSGQQSMDEARNHGLSSMSPQHHAVAHHNPSAQNIHNRNFNDPISQQYQMATNQGRSQDENVSFMPGMQPNYGEQSRGLEENYKRRTDLQGMGGFDRPGPSMNQFSNANLNAYSDQRSSTQDPMPSEPQPAYQAKLKEGKMLHSVSDSKESWNDNRNFANGYRPYNEPGNRPGSAQITNIMTENSYLGSRPQDQIQSGQFNQQYGQSQQPSLQYGQRHFPGAPSDQNKQPSQQYGQSHFPSAPSDQNKQPSQQYGQRHFPDSQSGQSQQSSQQYGQRHFPGALHDQNKQPNQQYGQKQMSNQQNDSDKIQPPYSYLNQNQQHTSQFGQIGPQSSRFGALNQQNPDQFSMQGAPQQTQQHHLSQYGQNPSIQPQQPYGQNPSTQPQRPYGQKPSMQPHQPNGQYSSMQPHQPYGQNPNNFGSRR